jgi:hypothetical protein
VTPPRRSCLRSAGVLAVSFDVVGNSRKWSGDTLVIDTIGLRDDTRIDWNGSVLTQAAKVREQIRYEPVDCHIQAAHRCRH